MRLGCDKFLTMRKWFDTLVELGLIYGYYPKPSKYILLTKSDRALLLRSKYSKSLVLIFKLKAQKIVELR